MEEEPVQVIREINRNVLFLNRRKHRGEETDGRRRSLANLRITQSDVIALANKLKTKSSISTSDLKLLQNALVDDPGSTAVVLNTHGALRGLVRELTGHDVSKQCAACSCLCNLALGDVKTGCTVAKAAGVYLVAALDSLTTQLAVTCAWTVGNLAGSGARACDLLTAQGALAKLCDVMHATSHMQEAAVYALTHACFVMNDDLRLEHLHKIILSLSKTELNIESSQLLFMLSCHKDFTAETLPEAYLQRVVEKLSWSIEHHLSVCQDTDTVSDRDSSKQATRCCELVFLLRVLANINSEKVYSGLDTHFVSNNLMGSIRRLLAIHVDKSLLWLLGNMVNSDCGTFLSVL